MSFFNFYSFLAIICIFILGIFIYKDPKNKMNIKELGSFCQITSFIVSLIYVLKKYDAFVGSNIIGYYEFWYFITLNLYGSLINFVLKIFVRFKYKADYKNTKSII